MRQHGGSIFHTVSPLSVKIYKIEGNAAVVTLGRQQVEDIVRIPVCLSISPSITASS